MACRQNKIGIAAATSFAAMMACLAGCCARSAGTQSSAHPRQRDKEMAKATDYFTAAGTEWYSAFNQPSAQCRHNKTYIVYPDQDMDPAIVCYDHNRRAWSDPVKTGKNPLGAPDSHGNPALLIDRAGYLHVFYGCHGGSMKYARSAQPESISAWIPMPDPAPRATYPQVMQMSDGKIYLFYRAGGHCDDWVYRTSDDGGNAWTQATAVIRGVPPQDAWYASFAKGPKDTVHVGFVWKQDDNARHASGPEFTHRYDAFYMHRQPDGQWYNATGTRLTLPLSKADANSLCKVYDSLSQNQFTGACSVAVDGEGTAYLLFRLGQPYGTTTYAHKLARLKAGKWDIMDVGPAVDCGYAAYVRDDNFLLQVLSPGRIRAYLVNIKAGSPVRTELEQWDSADGGSIWSRTKTILSSTEYPGDYVLIAPKLVTDPHPDAYLVFGLAKRYLYGDSGFVKRPQSK